MRGDERVGQQGKRDGERHQTPYPAPSKPTRGKQTPCQASAAAGHSPRRRSNQTATAKPLLSRTSGAAPGSGGVEGLAELSAAAMEQSCPGPETSMEGAAGDPYRRPARRTQWLLSALAHHYGLDRGVENEIVVLATGLDQYLQEVFHHLDCRGAGRLPRADFRALCEVLGLRADGTDAAGDEATGDANSGDVTTGDAAAGVATDQDADAEEEALLALRAEPPELTFRQFHARLCGYFGTRAGPRLPRGALSEHIETQIRLRRPRRRRRPPHTPGPEGGPDGGPDSERTARLAEENSSLRELVEDLRAALQSSDARCLALQVRAGAEGILGSGGSPDGMVGGERSFEQPPGCRAWAKEEEGERKGSPNPLQPTCILSLFDPITLQPSPVPTPVLIAHSTSQAPGPIQITIPHIPTPTI